MTGKYVDDGINAGNENFEKLTEQASKTFESKPGVYDPFEFYGAHVSTLWSHMFEIDQRHYESKISSLVDKATNDDFRRTHALFSWHFNTRLDAACLANKAALATPATFSNDRIRELNKGICQAGSTPLRRLLYKPLNVETVHLHVYADVSNATNDDLSLQFGYLIILVDDQYLSHLRLLLAEIMPQRPLYS